MFRRPARRKSRRPMTLELLEGRQLLTGYTVTSAADSGAGTLRAAIAAADADGQVGADTISFNIPGGGVQTINLLTPLPAVTRTIAIDATMQPGSTPGGAPQVAIDGAAVAPGADGLWFHGGAGGSEVRGLAIGYFAPSAAGGGGKGILVQDAGKDLFQGDYLGINPDGVTANPNAYGIELDAPGNTVGGTTPGASNLISGNLVDGIIAFGSNAKANIIQGNKIGTDSSGIYSVGNLDGVDLASPGNIVGGLLPGQSNLISGNVGPAAQSGVGILLQGAAQGNLIEGNQIGVNSTGNAADPNVYGIYLGSPNAANAKADNVSQVEIYRNQIAGNFIGITGNGSALLIAGNTIGLNGPGTAALPNTGYGVLLGATGSTIGGTTSALGNTISGNGASGTAGTGLDLSGATDLVEGNRIGTNLAGTAAIPNVIGMDLHVASSTIGGTASGAGNIVSGNAGDGIRLDTNGSDAVQGNFIGNAPGGKVAGNGGDGIDLVLPAPSTPATTALALDDTIGGTTYGSGNFIIGNAGAGIAVANTYGPGISGLAFRSNTISGNGRLGIDLTSSGVASPGYLVITYATPASSGKVTITGIFHGTPGVGYPVDFFANSKADASGFGEGQYFLGLGDRHARPRRDRLVRLDRERPLGRQPGLLGDLDRPVRQHLGVLGRLPGRQGAGLGRPLPGRERLLGDGHGQRGRHVHGDRHQQGDVDRPGGRAERRPGRRAWSTPPPGPRPGPPRSPAGPTS